jgi:hypothetical protein
MDQPSKRVGAAFDIHKAHYIFPGCHTDFDTKTLFTELPDMLIPPPALATGHDNLCSNHPPRFLFPTSETINRHLGI